MTDNRQGQVAHFRKRILVASALAFAAVMGLPADGSAQTPKRGGTLSIALQLTTASLDPLKGEALGGDGHFQNLFAEKLIRQNSKYEFEPQLANKWAFENDGKSIRFDLRKGIRFHDGTPFNASAVKYNFDRLMNPTLVHAKRDTGALLSSIDLIDEYTVRVNFKEKSALSLSRLASAAGAICSPKAIAELGDDFGRKPSCTGPFEMVSWTGNRFLAKRNPNYWRNGEDGKPLPYLDGVEVNVVSNLAVRLVQLRSGNVHLIDQVLPKDFDQISQSADLKIVNTGKGDHQYIAFNITKPPFDNRDLRKAVSLAIDRQALVKVISPRAGSVLRYFESPQEMWVYDDSVPGHTYDLNQARELYKKSGHTGQVSVSIIQRDPDVQIAQLVQSMLKNIGMDVKIELLERQAFMAKVVPPKHDFFIARFGHFVDPDYTYSALYHKQGFFDVTGFDRTETTKLVEQARLELDQSKRRALYNQISDITTKDYFFTWLFRNPTEYAASQRMQNIEIDAIRALIYETAWLKD